MTVRVLGICSLALNLPARAKQEKKNLFVVQRRRLLYSQRLSSSFITDKTTAFLLSQQAGPCHWPHLTLSSDERLHCPAAQPRLPLLLPLSPFPSPSGKHSPELRSAEIGSSRPGCSGTQLHAGLLITAFLVVLLSNVRHFVWISFCVNMKRAAWMTSGTFAYILLGCTVAS